MPFVSIKELINSNNPKIKEALELNEAIFRKAQALGIRENKDNGVNESKNNTRCISNGCK